MSGTHDPWGRYDFNPPRQYLDDDSAFPQATVVTQSNDQGLEFVYTKQPGGMYTKLHEVNDSVFAYPPVKGSDFPAGVIATFLSASGEKVGYVKGTGEMEGTWILISRTGGRVDQARTEDIEELYQDEYRAQKPPDAPDIDYHNLRLREVVQDKAAVQNSEDPAYDGAKVANQKLSLRFLFPGITYDRPQFNVLFGRERRVISRGDLAVHIAKELRTLMENAKRDGKLLLRADGTSVEFDDLVLIAVAFSSKGSIKPVIGAVRP